MKRFLPLFILTGLLFGQDVLHLKSGESYKGTFYGKVGEDIVFKVEGETSTKKYSINDVETIVTKNGELTYPFDVPNMKSTEYKEWDYVSDSASRLSPETKKTISRWALGCGCAILLINWAIMLLIEDMDDWTTTL